MSAIDDAVAATSDALTSALYTALGGTMSVAQLTPIVQNALLVTDYANVLGGYVAADTVAGVVAAGGTPTVDQLGAYSTAKAGQSSIVHTALP